MGAGFSAVESNIAVVVVSGAGTASTGITRAAAACLSAAACRAVLQAIHTPATTNTASPAIYHGALGAGF